MSSAWNVKKLDELGFLVRGEKTGESLPEAFRGLRSSGCDHPSEGHDAGEKNPLLSEPQPGRVEECLRTVTSVPRPCLQPGLELFARLCEVPKAVESLNLGRVRAVGLATLCVPFEATCV